MSSLVANMNTGKIELNFKQWCKDDTNPDYNRQNIKDIKARAKHDIADLKRQIKEIQLETETKVSSERQEIIKKQNMTETELKQKCQKEIDTLIITTKEHTTKQKKENGWKEIEPFTVE